MLKDSTTLAVIPARGDGVLTYASGNDEGKTGITHFSKVRVMPLAVYERPAFVPGFAN